jgi:uncharacterized protein YjbJ (UPF0337 family)
MSGASHEHQQGPDQGSRQGSGGKIKEVSGALVGNETMEAKGKAQKNLGKAQAKYGDVKRDVNDKAKPA